MTMTNKPSSDVYASLDRLNSLARRYAVFTKDSVVMALVTGILTETSKLHDLLNPPNPGLDLDRNR